MRPKHKVGTWMRIVAACAISALTTGVLIAPAHGAPLTGTASGLSNFGLALGTGTDAPRKSKSLQLTFVGATDPKVQFLIEKSDAAGNVVAGTSPVEWRFGGEGGPCTLEADGTCDLDEDEQEFDIDLVFRAASTTEAFAKFTYILKNGTTALHTGSTVITVLEGPDVGNTGPTTVYDDSCPTPGSNKESACAVGDEIDFTVRAQNQGAEPIKGVRVRFEFSSGIKPALTGSGNPIEGCVYTTGPSTKITVVVCEQPNRVVEPRESFTFELAEGEAPEGTIDSDAYGDEEVCFQVTPMQDKTLVYPPSGPCQVGNTGVLAGAALKQIEDIDAQDNWGYVAIKNVATQVFDLAAIGSTVSGAVGDEVTAQVGIANRGTGAIDTYRTKQPASRIVVKIPSGIQVKTPGTGCTNQTSFWLCSQPGSFLGAGDSFLFTFKLKIVSGSSDGEVSVREPGVDTRDSNPGNDQAGLRVRDGGGLPLTGLPVPVIVAIGLAFLLAGVVVFRLAKRRRPVSI